MSVEPCPEHWMSPPEEESDICTVLRAIYNATQDEEIRLKARIATTMAKKM